MEVSVTKMPRINPAKTVRMAWERPKNSITPEDPLLPIRWIQSLDKMPTAVMSRAIATARIKNPPRT